MFRRERLAIHFIGEKGVGVEGLFERNGTLEVRHGADGDIGAVENDDQ